MSILQNVTLTPPSIKSQGVSSLSWRISSVPIASFFNPDLPRWHTPQRHHLRCLFPPLHDRCHIWILELAIFNVWVNKVLNGTLALNMLLGSWTDLTQGLAIGAHLERKLEGNNLWSCAIADACGYVYVHILEL